MEENMQGSIQAGSGSADWKKRLGAALIDLALIPVLIGVLVGLLLPAIPEDLRPIVLVLVNMCWLVVRDMVFAPGRMVMKIKLVSLTGDNVTFVQALLRNVLIGIPFLLVLGYIVESVFVIVKGNRLMDGVAKTQVVSE